jgi:hypothetical protein
MPRQDPLAAMLARKQITPTQHVAARRWRQADAAALARCRQILGAEGNALLGLVLTRGQSLREVAAARGFDARPGSNDLIYIGHRLRECLDAIGEVLVGATRRGQPFPSPPMRPVEGLIR